MKIIDRKRAAELIDDGAIVYVGGFGAYSGVDELMRGLAERKRAEGHPSDLTVLSGICSGFGNMEDIGHNILCEDGLVDTIIAGHYMISGKMSRMVSENRLAAYAVPLGAVVNMLRAGASGQPGVLMKVGLETYVDPRVDGCAVNEKAKEQMRSIGADLIKHVEFGGEEYLFYKALKPDACLIRGTFADGNGNISLRHEGLHEYQLEVAMATKNNGGTVIVQVEELVENGQIPPKEVRIPGMMVDYVVVGAPENSRQMYGSPQYDPAISAEARIDAGDMEPMPLDVRKVIARRAAKELPVGTMAGSDKKQVVNLGIGLPAGVGIVAAEEGFADELTLSLETGPIGGIPLDGAAFAGAVNHEALMNAADVFAFYDGGGLDMAFLGAAEVDAGGNVNVSMFGTRCAGPGGFINITQNTPKVCFMGTFAAGKQDIRVGGGELTIISDAGKAKFTDHVQQITFSGDYAGRTGQEVLYVTERAVFRLVPDGLELIEIAPGIDLQKDVLDKMEFVPIISKELKVMDKDIFM